MKPTTMTLPGFLTVINKLSLLVGMSTAVIFFTFAVTLGISAVPDWTICCYLLPFIVYATSGIAIGKRLSGGIFSENGEDVINLVAVPSYGGWCMRHVITDPSLQTFAMFNGIIIVFVLCALARMNRVILTPKTT